MDDVAAARAAVTREGLAIVGQSRRSFDFLDPWGNRFQVVGYGDIQFERVDGVKRRLGIEELEKTDDARRDRYPSVDSPDTAACRFKRA